MNRATLTVEQGTTMINKQKHYVRLNASNGEPLMHGEMLTNGARGREAVLDAMIDVLRQEGWEVTRHQ